MKGILKNIQTVCQKYCKFIINSNFQSKIFFIKSKINIRNITFFKISGEKEFIAMLFGSFAGSLQGGREVWIYLSLALRNSGMAPYDLFFEIYYESDLKTCHLIWNSWKYLELFILAEIGLWFQKRCGKESYIFLLYCSFLLDLHPFWKLE